MVGWSLGIHNLQSVERLEEDKVKLLCEQHHMYGLDAMKLFKLAKQAGFASCTISGGRTPDPYNPEQEISVLSIVGFTHSTDFNDAMRKVILSGPDAEEIQ